jgi:hypothetical protein
MTEKKKTYTLNGKEVTIIEHESSGEWAYIDGEWIFLEKLQD